ncbi:MULTISPECIES: hypothetical protein [unclassified Moorena]|uniref:Uncharacterized protein n=1 Tax=Moorena producens 3L TaxID=489825 RepID=F4XZJ4_9CYAN|nr:MULTISPECIES: hypothetical protein [unclassified Moorena]EGJ29999.1 hypothetical protein LYNGBM3L_58310 [Moorena producens 3L]NEP30852.1 hypothetical protein [Moorena sp. SIO3B2]NEQ12421.1 hypothetical protein [Moorena sp. SIO3E2]NES40297.1 hypothetical protein [Moorena sp. SIO2C4]
MLEVESRESGVGSRESGVGSRESGVGSREWKVENFLNACSFMILFSGIVTKLEIMPTSKLQRFSY